MKSLIGFIINSSVFIAITAATMLFFSFTILGIIPKWRLIAAIACMTYSVYTTNKLSDIKEDRVNNPKRVQFVENNKKLLIISTIISYATALMLGIFEHIIAFTILLIPFVTGIAYSGKLKRIPKLKNIFLVKNITIAFNFATCGTILPAIYLLKDTENTELLLIIFIFIFTKYFINGTMFDVSDMKGDKEHRIKTLPVVIGLKRTAIFLQILNLILAVILLIFSKYCGEYIELMIISVIYSFGYVMFFCFITKKNYNLLRNLVIDGEWILLGICAYFISAYAT